MNPSMVMPEEAQDLSESFIGDCSGALWQYLKLHGKSSLIKLKSDLSHPASTIHLALGWLLREGKINLSREQGHIFISLKGE